MKKTTVIVLAVWLICGIFNAGVAYAYFQGQYPTIAQKMRGSNAVFALYMGIFGPTGVPVSVFGSKFLKHGWKLPPLSAFLGK